MWVLVGGIQNLDIGGWLQYWGFNYVLKAWCINPITKIRKENKMPNFQNGKIYAIRSYQTEQVYVGSTTQPLSVRMGKHRAPSNITSSRAIMRFPDAYIELIENYPCADKNELNRREGEFIRSMDCVNRCIAGRTQAEYYADHNEELKQRGREYYADHNEELKQRSREYYADHNEELKQRSREWHAAHMEERNQRGREYNAAHKEELKQRSREWRAAHREEAKQSSREYYDDHKKMCVCMCGATYNSGKNQRRLGHYKSQRHMRFVADFQTRLTELLSH
jgi:hypothetical protein